MASQPPSDSDMKTVVFIDENYDCSIEKTVTAIQRWFRNQEDSVIVHSVDYNPNITGYGRVDQFRVMVHYTEMT